MNQGHRACVGLGLATLLVAVAGFCVLAKATFKAPPPIEVAELPKKTQLEHRQELWLAALEWCESRGRHDIKIMDSNDKHSYGAFQFQMTTFLAYGKQYGLVDKGVEEAEGENLIYDADLQRAVARRMLEDGLERHWLICSTRIGEPYPK